MRSAMKNAASQDCAIALTMLVFTQNFCSTFHVLQDTQNCREVIPLNQKVKRIVSEYSVS